MLQRIKNTNAGTNVTLFYGVRNDSSLFYFKEFLLDFFADGGSILRMAISRDISDPAPYK